MSWGYHTFQQLIKLHTHIVCLRVSFVNEENGDFCGQSCVEILDNDKQVIKLQVNKNKFLAQNVS